MGSWIGDPIRPSQGVADAMAIASSLVGNAEGEMKLIKAQQVVIADLVDVVLTHKRALGELADRVAALEIRLAQEG